MDSQQHEALMKMFYARRLQPAIPEHDVFIKAEIAKLEVLEPKDAESFKEFYGKALKSYEASLVAAEEDLRAQEANRKAVLLEQLKERLANPEPDVIGEKPTPAIQEIIKEVTKESDKQEVEQIVPKKKGRPSKKSSPK